MAPAIPCIPPRRRPTGPEDYTGRMTGESLQPGPPGDAPAPPGEVTRILQRVRGESALGGADADRLLELAYGELRRLAAHFIADERTGHTLQPTALVHEAWMRLVDRDRVEWRGRAHFMAIAAQAMRRILVEHARARSRDKRGGGRQAIELDPELLAAPEAHDVDVLALDEALVKLRDLSASQSRLVELRFFGGLSMDEVAEVLGISLRTAEREWRFARAWLMHELRGSPG